MALRSSKKLGVVLLVLGLIIAFIGSLTTERANLVERKPSDKGAWTISVYCRRGQKLGLGISPGNGWDLFLDTSDEFKVGGVYISYVPVTVLITTTAKPSKNITLEVEFSQVESLGQKSLLDVFVVKVLHKSDILKMETSIEHWTSANGTVMTSEYLNERKPQLGIGTVQYDGDYQVEIVAVEYIKPPQPPNGITLYVYNMERVMNYWYFIPLGSILMVSGAFMLTRKTRRHRKKAQTELVKKKVVSVWRGLLYFLILCFGASQFTVFCLASRIIYVNLGDSIQGAINSANPGDIIIIKMGVYREYPIFVNKSLTIVGESREGTVIDGEKSANLIINVLADNVKISNLTVQNTSYGSFPPVQVGIQVSGAENVEISDCILKLCEKDLRLSNSRFCKILRNRVEHAYSYGIHLDENSKYNEIVNNIISDNGVGIQVEGTATNNTIYHNNFVNNSNDVGGPNSGANNYWHNGYPSGGNFWDRSHKEDLKSGVQQNEDGSDGICDQRYNFDLYPLMGPVHIFKVGKWENQEFYVSIVSNAEILDFQFNGDSAYLQFTVNSPLQNFLRAMIPQSLLWVEEGEEWSVYLNGTLLENVNVKQDARYTYIYFQFNSGFWIVRVAGTNAIPEMLTSASLLFTSAITAVVAWISMRKMKRNLKFRI